MFRGFIIDVDEDKDDGRVLHHIEYDDKDQWGLSPKDCAEITKQAVYVYAYSNRPIEQWKMER